MTNARIKMTAPALLAMEQIDKLKILYPPEAFWTQRGGYANSSSMHHIIRENYGTCLSRENSKRIYNSAIRHGNLYEEVALKYLAHKYSTKISNVGSVQHPKYKFVRATPDGLAILNDRLTSIEIKCPVNPARVTAHIPEYLAQCHTAAQCCDTEQILFARFLFIEQENKYQTPKPQNPKTPEVYKVIELRKNEFINTFINQICLQF